MVLILQVGFLMENLNKIGWFEVLILQAIIAGRIVFESYELKKKELSFWH